MGSTVSILLGLVFVSFPFIIMRILKANKNNLDKAKFKAKFGDLYEAFRYNNPQALMCNVQFCVKRLLLAIGLIFMNGSSFV